MEALAALSLAGNILQFVDFGQKLVSRASEFYGSATSGLGVNAELEILTNDLSKLCASLVNSREVPCPYDTVGDSKEERDLRPLASSCQELASEFSALLQKLKRQSRGSAWASIRQALRSVWNDRIVKEYVRRLESYRSQVMVCLLDLLGSVIIDFLTRLCAPLADINNSLQGARVLSTLNQLSTAHHRLEINHESSLLTLKSEILRLLQEQMSLDKIKHTDTITEQHDSVLQVFRTSIGELRQLITTLLDRADRTAQEIKIIESLSFEELDARRSRIAEASPRTFDWIFNNDSFAKWLTSSCNTYWITGKPGSGKSTLMKYLCDHKRVRQALQSCAPGHTLIITNFFFWHSGTTMQKSQQELLQTLLCNIFRQCPSLIPNITPE